MGIKSTFSLKLSCDQQHVFVISQSGRQPSVKKRGFVNYTCVRSFFIQLSSPGKGQSHDRIMVELVPNANHVADGIWSSWTELMFP